LPSTTAVEGKSTMAECGLPLKSTDARASSVTPRIPFRAPLAAFRKGSVDGFDRRERLELRGQVYDRDVGGRDTDGEAAQLVLELREDEPDRHGSPWSSGSCGVPRPARGRGRCGKSWIGWSLVQAWAS
jgi:hypothetical protein